MMSIKSLLLRYYRDNSIIHYLRKKATTQLYEIGSIKSGDIILNSL